MLAAVDAAPSGATPVGQDMPRYAELVTGLRQRPGSDVVEEIGRLAAGTPLVQAVARAERLLSSLADDGSDPRTLIA